MIGTGLSLPELSVRRSGGGLPVPSALLMSNRLNQMGYGGYAGSDGVDTDSNSRLSFYNQTGTAVTRAVFYFANWMANATNEQAGFNPITVTAAVEYPAGTFQPVTFAGAGFAALAVDALRASDEMTFATPIPAGAQYWVRTYVSVSAGQKWPQGYFINTARGEAADFATGADKTLSGTISNATGSPTRRGFGPIGIKATGFAGTPVRRAFASVGDSILMASSDGNFDGIGSTGWNGRALSGIFPHVNFAIAGTTAAGNVPANFSRRLSALQAIGVTDVLVNYANNDLASTRTYAQVTADITAIVANLTGAGLRVHYCTPLPYTTSTDGWKTAANQTVFATNGGYLPVGSGSRYQQVSDWLRSGLPGLSGVVDISDQVSVNASNVLTRNGGYWLSGNGGAGATSSHLTASGVATDVATSDGRHPVVSNTTGPGYGGHYILRDYFAAYLAALPA